MAKSRSPFFTKALSFAGISTRRPLTSGAISMKFARTLASSVRGLRSVSRMTSNRARTEAAMTPIPMMRPHFLRSRFSATGSICLSSTEKDQPQQACQKDDDARIKERERAYFRLEAIAKQEEADHEGEDHACGHADHPGRKERANDVDRGGLCASGQQQASSGNAGETLQGRLHL